ncbi:MAG: copper chaperone PCu(A)C [Pseudomonadota bacterium]|nr:copper chaperone PCu(A)C [Pseudomonadota bacterium]
MFPTPRKLALAAFSFSLPLLAQAADPAQVPTAAHTTLHDCVIQEVLPGKNMTGAYLRLVHQGAPVQLSRAEVPGLSPRVELHSMAMQNGVMHMHPMTDLQLPEGERVFKKGADHVMLFDIAQAPAIGSRHTLHVYFSDNTRASCQAEVKAFQALMQGAAAHPPAHGHGQGNNQGQGHGH